MIVSILLFHSNWSTRGLFGVDAFFVLSGFLITLLLLRELEKSGRIRIGAFYGRRIKRLFPGLLITLSIVLGAGWVWSSSREYTEVAERALFSLLQVANWTQISDGHEYWDSFGQIDPLAHMWSLSITEQFYVVWPLLVLGAWWVSRRSPLVFAILSVVAVAGSAVVAPLLWDGGNSDRLYLGTDTRAVAFIAGAAAAAVVYWLRRRLRRFDADRTPSMIQRVLVTSVSVISLGAVVIASVMTTNYHEPWLYQGGLAGIAVCLAVFTATLTSRACALVPFFSFSVFRGLGKISYSLFLLHLPVYWLLQLLTPTIEPLVLFAVGGALTWILAAFVHYGITERMRTARWRWNRGMAVFSIAVLAVGAGASYLPDLRPSTSTVADGSSRVDVPAGMSGGNPLVLTLGDSLANDVAEVLLDHGSGSFEVLDAGQGGCGIAGQSATRATSGYEWDNTACSDWRSTWSDSLQNPVDVVVMHTGWDAATQLIDGTWMNPGDAAFDALYSAVLDEVAAMAADLAPQATVMLLTERPANGIVTDATMTAAFNDLLKKATERHDNLEVMDFGATFCPDTTCITVDDAGTSLFLPDNVHLSEAGMQYLAPRLEDALAVELSH